MKKVLCVAGLFLVAGLSWSDIVYSNNFEGTEYVASGVGTVELSYAVIGNGVVSATEAQTTSGFRVDLSALDLMNDSAVSAVKITATVRTPLLTSSTGWVGIGFGEGNYNMANGTTGGTAWFALVSAGAVRPYGGVGTTNPETQLSEFFTPNDTFDVEMIFYKNQTMGLIVDGATIYENEPLTISSTPTLSYAVVQLRNLSDYASGDGFVADFVVETIPEPATLGLFGVTALLLIMIRRLRQ